MKTRQKYLNPIIIFLCVYIFGLWIFAFGRGIVKWTYAYLNHLFPDLFPLYNAVQNAEKARTLESVYLILGVFVALFLINLISLKIDNKKYERLVILTDGQYLVKDGIKLYFKEFFISDAITSTVIPAVLVIPAYLLSEDILGYFGLIIWNWLGYHLSTVVGLFPAILLAAAFSFIGRMIAIPQCVKAWRAAWLTDI